MSTYVIAEAGSTHDGHLGKMMELIDTAAWFGADAVKFQWLSSAERLCARRRAPAYLEAYKLLEFPEAWLNYLKHAADLQKLDFLCTVFLPEDVKTIAQYVRHFKVASFEAGDPAFLEEHAPFLGGDPPRTMYVSLGMAQAVTVGNDFMAEHVRFLHCVSAYPAPTEQMNLSRIMTCDGLSDHSKHPWTGGLAVAAGAHAVEFHFRLPSTDPKNADFEVARTPGEAMEYVRHIRLAESMMGTGEDVLQPAEEWAVPFKAAEP